MMHKTWCCNEEVPVWIHRWIWNDVQSLMLYRRDALFFSRSFIKFQGHTGWSIDDWNPIWARLLGRSQLSNPLDLPCLEHMEAFGIWYRRRNVICNVLPCRYFFLFFNGETLVLTKERSCHMRTRFSAVSSLWPSDTIWQHGSGSTLAQVMACCLGTKPLIEPMLTDHQWSPVTFILGPFNKRCLNCQWLKSVWKLHI